MNLLSKSEHANIANIYVSNLLVSENKKKAYLIWFNGLKMNMQCIMYDILLIKKGKISIQPLVNMVFL